MTVTKNSGTVLPKAKKVVKASAAVIVATKPTAKAVKASAVTISSGSVTGAGEVSVTILGKKQVAERICAMVKAEGKAVPQSIAELMVESFDSVIAQAMSDGQIVRLGIGSFKATKTEEREGRNPATGEAVHIPSRLVPKFKSSSTLKRALNDDDETVSESEGSEA